MYSLFVRLLYAMQGEARWRGCRPPGLGLLGEAGREDKQVLRDGGWGSRVKAGEARSIV